MIALPTIASTEDVFLWGFTEVDDCPDSVRSRLFGEMQNRSVTEMFKSDFYHDALWIAANVHGPVTFPWVTRECGTNIGSGEWMDATYDLRSRITPFHAYIVTVYNDADDSSGTGAWRVRFDRVAD